MRNKCEANHVLYRDGIYYYVRRVPHDLTSHYDVKRLCSSLKTKSASAAIRASKSINQRLEDCWLGLRLQNVDIPAIQVVKSSDAVANDSLLMTEACELYLRLKSVGRGSVFSRTAKRNTNYVTQLLGDKAISSYSSAEAGQLRDWCMKKGMSIPTVKRVFSSIRAIINLAIAERGLECRNPFANTFFPDDDNVQSRQPISNQHIRKVQSLCKEIDDDMRWLIALVSDTGMRLGEAAGLLKADIKINDGIPHIDLKPHSWKNLKTKGSQSVPDRCVIHLFRHSLRDRLRAVECPADIIDAIGVGLQRELVINMVRGTAFLLIICGFQNFKLCFQIWARF